MPRQVVLNKADLADAITLRELGERYDAPGVSAATGAGVQELKTLLAGKLGGGAHASLPEVAAAYGAPIAGIARIIVSMPLSGESSPKVMIVLRSSTPKHRRAVEGDT